MNYFSIVNNMLMAHTCGPKHLCMAMNITYKYKISYIYVCTWACSNRADKFCPLSVRIYIYGQVHALWARSGQAGSDCAANVTQKSYLTHIDNSCIK